MPTDEKKAVGQNGILKSCPPIQLVNLAQNQGDFSALLTRRMQRRTHRIDRLAVPHVPKTLTGRLDTFTAAKIQPCIARPPSQGRCTNISFYY